MAKIAIDAITGCWLWTASQRKGYGQISVARGRSDYAHRVSYQLHCGPIDLGQQVLHRCDRPLCVNPDHLFLGTSADNMADMARKGRSLHGSRNAHAVLSEAQATEARRLRREERLSYRDIAARLGVSVTTARRACTGESFRRAGGDPTRGDRIGQAGVRNGRAKLTASDAEAIRQSKERRGDLAARYGVSKGTIDKIRYGQTWRQKSEPPGK